MRAKPRQMRPLPTRLPSQVLGWLSGSQESAGMCVSAEGQPQTSLGVEISEGNQGQRAHAKHPRPNTPAAASQTHQRSQCRTPPRHKGGANIRGSRIRQLGRQRACHASQSEHTGIRARGRRPPIPHVHALCTCRHHTSANPTLRQPHTAHPPSQVCNLPQARQRRQPAGAG